LFMGVSSKMKVLSAENWVLSEVSMTQQGGSAALGGDRRIVLAKR
jgi:hypothetical protein